MVSRGHESPTQEPDALLARLYGHVCGGEGLQTLLADVAGAFGAVAGHLIAVDTASSRPLWDCTADLTGGVLSAGAHAYTHHHWRHDPRRNRVQFLADNQSFRCSDRLNEKAVSRSEFFQDFFIPSGLRWTLVGRLPGGERGVATDLALLRSVDSPDFSPLAPTQLSMLLPHLRRMLAVHDLQQRAATAEAVADELWVSTALLDALGRPLALHGPLCEMLHFRSGELLFGAPGHIKRRHEAFAASWKAVMADGRARQLVVPLSLKRGDVLWVTLTRQQIPGQATRGLLLLRRPQGPRSLTALELAPLFGLSPREAEIGCALLAGQTPREYWEQRGLSPPTVRTQLRALYAKTGTRGQSDFVRLVSALTFNG